MKAYIVYVMVNFMCQLDWEEGSQTAGEALFLGVAVWVFPRILALKSVD